MSTIARTWLALALPAVFFAAVQAQAVQQAVLNPLLSDHPGWNGEPGRQRAFAVLSDKRFSDKLRKTMAP